MIVAILRDLVRNLEIWLLRDVEKLCQLLVIHIEHAMTLVSHVLLASVGRFHFPIAEEALVVQKNPGDQEG